MEMDEEGEEENLRGKHFHYRCGSVIESLNDKVELSFNFHFYGRINLRWLVC